MKISTEIRSAARLVGEEKAVELIAKAGFDAWDFSMLSMVNYDWKTNKCSPCSHPLAGKDHLLFAKKLKRIGLDNGIVCNQSHAPYPTYCREIRDCFERSLECTAEAGGELCVIHPDNFLPAKENALMFLELLPLAKQYGVKIAVENMWSWSDKTKSASPAACSEPHSFLAHLNEVNDPFFVACLDIGHAELFGLNTDACSMIDALGPHLQALHIHDNDKKGDLHLAPFLGSIDLPAVADALKRNGYSGFLTLEACSHLASFDADGVQKGLLELFDSAKRFEKLVTG